MPRSSQRFPLQRRGFSSLSGVEPDDWLGVGDLGGVGPSVGGVRDEGDPAGEPHATESSRSGWSVELGFFEHDREVVGATRVTGQ